MTRAHLVTHIPEPWGLRVREAVETLAKYHREYHRQHSDDPDKGVTWLDAGKGVVIAVFDDPEGLVRKSIEAEMKGARVSN